MAVRPQDSKVLIVHTAVPGQEGVEPELLVKALAGSLRVATFPRGYSGILGDHPISWCHDKFAGRAWYSVLGQEPCLYSLPEYRHRES